MFCQFMWYLRLLSLVSSFYFITSLSLLSACLCLFCLVSVCCIKDSQKLTVYCELLLHVCACLWPCLSVLCLVGVCGRGCVLYVLSVSVGVAVSFMSCHCVIVQFTTLKNSLSTMSSLSICMLSVSFYVR